VHDLTAIRSRFPRETVASNRPEQQEAVTLGAHWHNVVDEHRAQREQLVRLAQPAAFVGECGDFVLHPSLLDTATSLALHLPDLWAGATTRSYFPFEYRRLTVWEALPPRLLSYIRHLSVVPQGSGTVSFDIDLMDEDGRALVSIEGYTVRIMDLAAMHAAVRESGPTPAAGLADHAERTAMSSAIMAEAEFSITPGEGTDLLWRVLAHGTAAQYVVCREGLDEKIQRVANTAAQLTSPATVNLSSNVSRDRQVTTTYVAPGSVTEKAIAELWQDSFGVSEVGVEDDFFELGGNSLVALQIVVRLRDQFRIELPGITVFDYRTVRALAPVVEKAMAQAVGSRAQGSAR
jgi:acyl carrier protein